MKKRRLVIFSSLILSMLIVTTVVLAQENRSPQINGNTSNPVSLLPDQGASYKSSVRELPTPNTYIIQLADPPLASYQGGIQGIAATSPQSTGAERLDIHSPASLQYQTYLAQKQDRLVSAMSAEFNRPVAAMYQYRTSLNGISVELSETEAEQVAKLPGVISVLRDEWHFPTTDTTPAFIGATAIWDGSATGGLPGTKGEGVIVGIIDTGIWPEHPSFKDDGSYAPPPAYWGGYCQRPDDGTTWLICNHKLIGAQHFLDAYIAALGTYNGLFNSARDDHSHGTHTASTAAGNENVPVTMLGHSYGTMSGMAPRAYVAAYKALGPYGGLTSDLVAAIDKAVADGVDVINYSIGSVSRDPWQEASALAFLNARNAGVFVASSAGNSGPEPATVGSPGDAPWITTVGASTSNRAFLSEITITPTLTIPMDMYGASMTVGVHDLAFVDAANYTDSTGVNGRLCLNPFTTGTFTANQVVLCERGENARVDKSANVKAGGAGGMVLANSATDSGIVADSHSVPSVHVSYELGSALRQQIADHPDVVISFTDGQAVIAPNPNIFPDNMGSFSSRGPTIQGGANYVKPNITAPGVDILAGYTPQHYTEGPQGEYFGLMSGTSMASPHVAGAGALMVALHPDWTPAEIESALTTTANSLVWKEDTSTPADPFDMGSGRVDLFQAAKAGLVLNETKANYLAANPALGGDPATLNLASLANGQCLTFCDWERTVQSTLDTTVTWTADIFAPVGMVITVTPQTFELAPGGQQTIEVAANLEGLEADGSWQFATLTLTPSDSAIPEAHFPVVVLPTNSIMPERLLELTDQKSGSRSVQIIAREISQMNLRVDGLTPGTVSSQNLSEDPTPDDPYDNLNDGTNFYITVEVPVGASRLVAETLESTAVDLDLYMGTGAIPSAATEACASHAPTTIEYCNINAPVAGTWWILVQNWRASANPPDAATLVYAVVDDDQGNLTATAPDSVPAYQPFNLEIDWAEPALQPEDRYYGAVVIGSDAAHPDNIGYLGFDVRYVGQAVLEMDVSEIQINVAAGSQKTETLTIGNTGDIDLNWNLGTEETASPVVLDLQTEAAPAMADLPMWGEAGNFSGISFAPVETAAKDAINTPNLQNVALVLDDGSGEEAVGAGGSQFIWLNRFTPAANQYPFVLTEVQVMFTTISGAKVGDALDIYIYEDTDGDSDPGTGAQFLTSIQHVQVQTLNAFSVYPLANPVMLKTPGDVLIAVVNRDEIPGVYPAAMDTNSNHLRSWVGLYAAGAPADPPVLPADTNWGLISSFGLPGNWMIRGYGQNCGSADAIPWLTVSPTEGAVPAGESATINLSVDASDLENGTYTGLICLMTNANNLNSAILQIPITLEVADHYIFLPLITK